MNRQLVPHPRRLLTAIAITALSLLAGCTETLVGFQAVYPSNTVAVGSGPLRPDTLEFALHRGSYPARQRTIHPMPQRAILKLNGFMPQRPTDIVQEGDRTIVRVRLPSDLLKEVKAGSLSHQRIAGELILPFDVGIPAFGGGEYREPASHTVQVQLTPVFSGPMTRTAERIGQFLRGLYAAR